MVPIVGMPIDEILADHVGVHEQALVEVQLHRRLHGLIKDYCWVVPRSEYELIALKPVLLNAESDIAETLRRIQSGELSMADARMETWLNFSRYLQELESIAPSGM